MAFALYDATMPTCLQTLTATIGWQGKAAPFGNHLLAE
jgi:hypothetical protein